MKEHLSRLTKESGLKRRQAVGLLAVALLTYLSFGCESLSAASAAPTYPFVTAWEPEQGYLYDGKVRDLGSEAILMSENSLCDTADKLTQVPFCQTALEVLQGMGVEPLRYTDYLERVIVVDEGLAPLCGEGSGACLQRSEEDYLLIMHPEVLVHDSFAKHLLSHEFTHLDEQPQVLGRGSQPIFTVVGTDNISEDESCVRLSLGGGQVCTRLSDGSVSCENYGMTELEAVVASRTYMILQVDAACASPEYTTSHLDCSGGYAHAYFPGAEIEGVMSRSAVVHAINLATDYFSTHEVDYLAWLAARRMGRREEAHALLAKAFRIDGMPPELTLQTISEIDTAMVAYAEGYVTSYATSTPTEPFSEVCVEE